jgi:glycosyltransferase involved in cell wall biosynthesis
MSTKKNIAFVIHGLVMGGAEKFLISLINHFDKIGYTTYLILLSNDIQLLHELNPNTCVLTILRKNQYDIFVSKRIKNFIQSNQIEKIFCVNTFSFFLVKLAYLFNTKTKFYLSLHSTIPSSAKVFIQNLLYFRTVGPHDLLLYLCDHQRSYLKKKYFFNHNTDLVINNGIDTQLYNPSLFEREQILDIKRDLHIPFEDKVIIKIARLHPEKGHEDAFRALSILHTQFGKQTHLIVVGGGPPSFFNHLQSIVLEQRLSDHIHFVGEQKDVRKYLSIADIFTLTSFGTETFSLAALEAMSFGIPCSLTNIGGAAEMIIDGVNGVLSEPKNPDSIALSWNTILESDMSKSIIRNLVVKRFDEQRMFDAYTAVIG